MKYKQNRHIAKLIFMTIIAFALSGGCFFVGMNWSTWFPSVAEVPVNPDPMVQDPNTDGGNPKSIAETNKYTDFTYRGKVYRVEKSLLTEAGSQYSASNRYYRFVNNKWEVRAEASSPWKSVSPADISIILVKWDKKFKAEESKKKENSKKEEPKKEEPKKEEPKKEEPKKEEPRKDEPKKSSFEPSYDEIKNMVVRGICNENCILTYKTLNNTQKARLLQMMPK
jgi:hypothetical protein